MQKKENELGFIALTPDEGYTLYNEEAGILSKSVYCSSETAERWTEVSDAEAAAIKTALEAQAEAEAEERKAKRHIAEE